MNNYQQRIRERAEQFFKSFMSDIIFFVGDKDVIMEGSGWEDEMYTLAKLSVDAEAQAVRQAMEGKYTQTYINDYLMSWGLIPPPENSNKQE